MQIAEEADGFAIGPQLVQHQRRLRLGQQFRLPRLPGAVQRLEILAVETELRRMLPRQHRVRPRARRHQHGARRECRRLLAARKPDRLAAAGLVHIDGRRRQPFGKADAFLQRLGDFLMVERVARRVDQAAAIGDGHAAPAIHQFAQPRRAQFPAGQGALLADGAGMGDELVHHGQLRRRPAAPHRLLALLGRQHFIAPQELLHLQRVIGQRLGRRVDRGQAAADHHHRQPQLQIGDRVHLRGTGELQRHQEVRRHAHTRRQAVGQIEDRRLAGAQRQRHMVEAEIECLIQGDRAAEAHAAEHGEARPPLQQQADDLEEVLVPAHGDAVFGDAAETGHGALAQILVQLADVVDRLERHAPPVPVDAGIFRRQRLDLQAVHRHHGVAVIQQVMRQRESRRPQARHQHPAAAGGLGHGIADIQRIPPRQQAIDLETPGQREHVLHDAGLGLRNIHRLLLLVDAGLHAIVADAVAGAGDHGIVHDHHGKGAQRHALGLEGVHLRNLLFQRAAREGHAERALAIIAVLLLQALGAGVLPLVVAEDAVMRLIEAAAQIHAGVGQGKAFAAADMARRRLERRRAVVIHLIEMHQMLRIHLLRRLEQDAGGMPGTAVR